MHSFQNEKKKKEKKNLTLDKHLIIHGSNITITAISYNSDVSDISAT